MEEEKKHATNDDNWEVLDKWSDTLIKESLMEFLRNCYERLEENQYVHMMSIFTGTSAEDNEDIQFVKDARHLFRACCSHGYIQNHIRTSFKSFQYIYIDNCLNTSSIDRLLIFSFFLC